MDSFTRYAQRPVEPAPMTVWEFVKVMVAVFALAIITHLDLIIWGV
jgi:hypothetical protein